MRTCRHTWLFYVSLEDSIQVLILIQQALYPLRFRSSPRLASQSNLWGSICVLYLELDSMRLNSWITWHFDKFSRCSFARLTRSFWDSQVDIFIYFIVNSSPMDSFFFIYFSSFSPALLILIISFSSSVSLSPACSNLSLDPSGDFLIF